MATTGLAAKRSAAALIRAGLEGGCIDGDPGGAAFSTFMASIESCPADGQRDRNGCGRAPMYGARPSVVAVISKDQFVRPFPLIVGGPFRRVTDILQVYEARSFHNPSVADI